MSKTENNNEPGQVLPRILVVDDIQENLQIVGETLSRHLDCDLAFAMDGRQVLDVVKEYPPDIILLDIMMPGITGLEVCTQLKANEQAADIPILFLTAKSEDEDIIRGFQAGAVDYIAKPFNPYELVARVRTHLRLRQAGVTIARQNDTLRQLLHILCHDLATPVGNVYSLLTLMEDGDDWRPLMPHLTQEAANAMDLINLVRQMRALEEGKMRLTISPVNLSEAFQSAAQSVASKLQKKAVTLSVRVDPTLSALAEPVALSNSVLCNLLTNAIKFSSPGDTILLEASQQDSHSIRIQVQDTGIGMPSELLASLFDPAATTSRPGTSDETGTGFGMILVKQFVEAFCGSMDVLSREQTPTTQDHGTTISIHLQAAPFVQRREDNPCGAD